MTFYGNQLFILKWAHLSGYTPLTRQGDGIPPQHNLPFALSHIRCSKLGTPCSISLPALRESSSSATTQRKGFTWGPNCCVSYPFYCCISTALRYRNTYNLPSRERALGLYDVLFHGLFCSYSLSTVTSTRSLFPQIWWRLLSDSR